MEGFSQHLITYGAAGDCSGRSVGQFKVDGGIVYRVKDAVLFGFASAEVSPEGREILQRIAAARKAMMAASDFDEKCILMDISIY